MAWTNIDDVMGMRCCSARDGVSGDINISGSDITLSSGAKMKKIPLSVWANRNDSTLFTFNNSGIKIAEAGDYLISASISYKKSTTYDNHGIYIIDSNGAELTSAHYYNYQNSTSNGCGVASKIVTLAANTTLYLCTYSQNANNVPVVTGSSEGTFLTIIKL